MLKFLLKKPCDVNCAFFLKHELEYALEMATTCLTVQQSIKYSHDDRLPNILWGNLELTEILLGLLVELAVKFCQEGQIHVKSKHQGKSEVSPDHIQVQFSVTIPNVSLENQLSLQKLLAVSQYRHSKCNAEMLLIRLIVAEVRGRLQMPTGKPSMLQLISKQENEVVIQVSIPYKQKYEDEELRNFKKANFNLSKKRDSVAMEVTWRALREQRVRERDFTIGDRRNRTMYQNPYKELLAKSAAGKLQKTVNFSKIGEQIH